MQIDFGRLFAAMPSPMLVLVPHDGSFTVAAANDAYLATVGRTCDDLIGRTAAEAFPDNPDAPDTAGAASMRASLQRVLASGQPDVMPVQRYDVVGTDGGFDERWWDAVNTPVIGPDDSVHAIIHQVTDATGRVRAEAGRRESESELQRMTDALPVLVSYIGHDERYRFVNKTYEEWFGHRRDEIRDRHMREVLGEEAHAQLRPAIVRALSGEQLSFESRVAYRDGGTRDVYVEYVPRVDDGRVQGFYALVQDIGDRVQAEAELRASETRLHAVVEQASAGIVQNGLDGRFTDVNDRYCEIVGRSREDLLRLRMQDITHPDDVAANLPLFEATASGGAPFEIEKRYVRPDGTHVWVRNSVYGLRGADGRVEAIGAVSIDLTERRAAEAALRDSEARLRFLGELDEALRGSRDAPQAMAAAAELLAKRLETSRCAYADVDDDTDRFFIRSDYSAPGIASSTGIYSLDLFGPRAAADMRQGRTLVVRDVAGELAPGEGRQAFQAIGVDAIICCPLVKDSRLVAMMAVHQDRPRDWSTDEISLVEAVVERCWAHVERVGAEARLRASEERYRQIVEGADDFAIIAMNEAGNITTWNSGAERLLGFSEEEVVGQPGAIFFTPEDREAGVPEHELSRADSSGRAINERWHMRKDGSRFWGSGLMMDLDDGGFLKMFRDRTAEHEAEARVRDSEAELTGVLDSMAEGFVLLDREFRIQRINAEALRIETRPESGMIGRTHWEVWPGSEEAPQGQLYKRLMREGGSGEVEVHYEWPDRDGWFDARAYATPEGLAIFFRDISDRKRVEAALAAKAVEFKALAENVSQLAWMAEPEGHIYWYNKRWYEFTGTTLDEMLGWGWQKVHHPEHVERVTAEWSGCIARGERFESTFPLRGADGAYRWFLTRAEPIRDSEGRLVRWFGTNTDITAQREAEERYRTLFESIESGFCIAEVDLDGPEGRSDYRIVEANPAFYRQTGFPEAVLGQWLRQAAPDLEEHWYEIYGRIAVTGEPRRFEEQSAALGRWFDVYAFRVGKPEERRVAILFNDISARRSAEDRLRELNERLETRVAERTAELERTWRVSQDLLVVVEQDGTLAAVNAAWINVFGWQPSELIGRTFMELTHPSDLEAALAKFQETFATPLIDPFVFRLRHKDGSYRWIAWTAAFESGQIYANGRDMTAERAQAEALAQAEEALRQSHKMEAMGQLTGGVAHDFNNLLTPIVGTLDMLQRKNVGSEREQRLIGGAVQSADRAKTLVQRLLAFARRQPLQTSAVDVGALTRGMADLVSSTTGPQIKVVVDARDELPAAAADPNQLEMAILNLAVNARDAMPEGGTLRISVSAEEVGRDHPRLRPGAYVRLSVADTGVGMDEATLQRAIEPFFSTKGIGKGTGLGLSMVHGLASQLGGTLLIHSQPGIGTNVEFWLPVSRAPVREAGLVEALPTATGPRGTALLVDDEELVRASTADMLIDFGHEVIEADSAEAALRLIEQGLKPDLLVTDHLMPGMTGTELARSLRARLPDMAVLIVSGYADADGIAPDLARLTKPFGSAQLAAAVANAIDQET